LARQPNYDFEKRKKELDRKAKKEAKRDERARRRREGAAEDDTTANPQDTGSDAPPE
jgi:hypothetical protein